jgi:GNAT superfamily N-acetyltransferase
MNVIDKTLSTATRPPIRRAAPSEKADVLASLSAAFENDPAARGLYPLATDYQQHFPSFVESFAGIAFADGIVERTADGMGIALWLPPGIEPDPITLIAHLQSTIEDLRRNEILAGIKTQARLHPHEPHWYLPFIGVRPEAQGQRLGGYLLQHGLRRADAEGLPAYLEATSARSARLYHRHGFEVIGVVDEPHYPRIFAMWRHPASITGNRTGCPPQMSNAGR